MNRCCICHFVPQVDDIAVEAAGGLTVCLACYGNQTETRLQMPKELRRELESCLRELVA